MAGDVKFIRVHGRVVPIKAPAFMGAGKLVKTARKVAGKKQALANAAKTAVSERARFTSLAEHYKKIKYGKVDLPQAANVELLKLRNAQKGSERLAKHQAKIAKIGGKVLKSAALWGAGAAALGLGAFAAYKYAKKKKK